jgi:uncharacterized protein YneF (UPF0154 family)
MLRPRRQLIFALRIVFSILAGLVTGIFFHYLLYRFTLPMEPFIYVAF